MTTGQIHDFYTRLAPTLVNEFSVVGEPFVHPAYEQYRQRQLSLRRRVLPVSPPALPNGLSGYLVFPGNNAPVSWDGTNSHVFNEAQNTYDAQENLLWTKGKHNLTFGFQYQALEDNENTPLTGTQAGFTIQQ